MTASESFRAAVESKDLAAITATLDPDIEFHSPIMVKPYHGRERVTALLRVLLHTFEDFHYTHELVGPAEHGRLDTAGVPCQALVFDARVMGKAVQGLDLIALNDSGLVSGLTVMVRPLPAAMTLARAVGKQLEELSTSA